MKINNHLRYISCTRYMFRHHCKHSKNSITAQTFLFFCILLMFLLSVFEFASFGFARHASPTSNLRGPQTPIIITDNPETKSKPVIIDNTLPKLNQNLSHQNNIFIYRSTSKGSDISPVEGSSPLRAERTTLLSWTKGPHLGTEGSGRRQDTIANDMYPVKKSSQHWRCSSAVQRCPNTNEISHQRVIYRSHHHTYPFEKYKPGIDRNE